MNLSPQHARWLRWLSVGSLAVIVWSTAQTRAEPPANMPDAVTAAASPFSQATMSSQANAGPVTQAIGNTGDSGAAGQIMQTGCAACGGGLGGGTIGGGVAADGVGCASCGAGGCASGCYPGRRPCDCCCDSDGFFGKTFCGLYQCICCPDPCYDPHWVAAADAAFFSDAPRPITQMRIRYDAGFDLTHPDRAEYFWAREKFKNTEVFISPCDKKGGPGKGPTCLPDSVDYEDLSLYMEAATGRFSAFVEMPYREVDPNGGLPTIGGEPNNCCHRSGFADINVGTKSLLLDCELLQLTFQFKTFIPSGSTGNGLGVGHVSLEPALLFAFKLAPKTYLQGETAYWIPIGGDDLYQGNVWHNHLSLNHVLWCPCHDVQLIGTAEINEWSVFQGNYTGLDFRPDGSAFPIAVSATATMASAGPGIRIVVCDKLDIGVGTAFAFTGDRWAEELIRTEFRWRF